MPQYTVTLTEAQDKALKTDIVDLVDWLAAFPKAKAESLMQSIATTEIQRRLAAGETISGTLEDLVLAAQVESAADRVIREAADRAAEEGAGQPPPDAED